MTDKKSKRVYTISIINLVISFMLLVVVYGLFLAGLSTFATLSIWAVINILTSLFEQYLLYSYGYRKSFKFDWINFFKFVGYNLPFLLFSMSFGRLLDISGTATLQMTGLYEISLFIAVIVISVTPLVILSQYGNRFIAKMYK